MVSIIISTHNRPIFLQRAVASAFNQSVSFEIIIIDDSSLHNKKRNIEVLNSFPSVKYFSIKCKGVSHSRNFGASQAMGKYLAFLDDDDYWLKGYLESCIKLVKTDSVDVVLTGFWEEKEGKMAKEKMPPSTLAKNDFLLKNPGLRGSNLFIYKNLFLSIKGFDEDLPSHNDLDLGYRLFELGKISYKNNPGYFVVFNNDNRRRLSSINSKNKKNGLTLFYKKYYPLMNIIERKKFLDRAKKFWNETI